MTQKFCDNCGAKLSPGSTFCDNCGHKIKDEVEASEAKTKQVSKNDDKPLVCENCGSELSPGDTFCDNCGHKIGDEVTISRRSVKRTVNNLDRGVGQGKKSRKTLKIILGAIVLIVVGLLVAFKSGFAQERIIKQAANSSGLGDVTDVDINLKKKTAYFVLTDEGEKEYGKELNKAISAGDPDEHLPMENATGEVVSEIIKQKDILGSDWTVSVSTRQPNDMLICFRNGRETLRFQDTDEGQDYINAVQDKESADEIAGTAGELVRAFEDGYNRE